MSTPHSNPAQPAKGSREPVFAPCSPVRWAVEGGGTFPVRSVWCVGKNYADHVREMGGDARRDPPVIFAKPASALVGPGASVPYPPGTSDLHFEAELVAAIGPDGVWGYAVGLDLTRRDVQAECKAAGRPWERAKAFAHSAPLGAIRAGAVAADAALTLHLNGELRQRGRLSDMIWGVADIVEYLRADMGLGAGDLVFTGTPAGVGAVVPGDQLEARVEGLPPLSVTIGEPR